MPSYAERYKFSEVEQDGQEFFKEMRALCKISDFSSITEQCTAKIGTKDVIAKQLASALKLMERQHLLIINQRGHENALLHDIKSAQSDIICLQEKLIVEKERVNQTLARDHGEFKNKIVEEISGKIEGTVKSGIEKSYSEVVTSQSKDRNVPREIVTTVAKQLIAEEELSRNIVVLACQKTKPLSSVTK